MPAAATARGKKKASAPEVTQVVPVEVAAIPEDAPPPAPIQTKKKSTASKKPVKVIAVVTPDGIEGSFAPEPRRPLIAHLQVHSNEVVFHDQAFRYDPTPPGDNELQGYDATSSNMFVSSQEELPFTVQGNISQKEFVAEKASAEAASVAQAVQAAAAAAAEAAIAHTKAMPCFTKVGLMVQFKGSAEKNCLPSSTDISCFWCTHPFEGMPCIIPEREVNGIYTVYGNFCAPECAAAFLLSEGLDPHVRWERMSLLHRIYDSDGRGRIFPAPAREALKVFGGPMTIESFRATVREKKVRVDLHMPPMVSILGSIDTKPIDFFDTNLKHSGPIVAAAAAQRGAEEGLRLKRTKPLKDKESTLDMVMNIRIGAAVRR